MNNHDEGSPDAKGDKDNPSATSPPAKEKKSLDLDLSSANRGVWLVKVPKYIAERWEASDSQSQVGKLTIKRVPGSKPIVNLTLDDKIAEARDETVGSSWSTTKSKIPKEHKFVVGHVAAQQLAVLSQTKGAPDKVSLEGKIVQRAECKAVDDQLYMNLKRESLLRPVMNARKAQKLEKLVIGNFKPVSNHAANIAYERSKKEEGKKMRSDKNEVMEKLFQLFEKHQYYNFRDLVAETRQPVPYLKTILNEVCRYNMKNPHKNMWELKPEFRHYKEEETNEEDTKDSDSD